MSKKILLICPHSALAVFGKSKISVVIPHIPYISLASLAATLLRDGHRVKILDLSISKNPFGDLKETLKVWQPELVGVTFTIGLLSEAVELARRIKLFDSAIKIVAGGAHPSVFPKEVVQKYQFDCAIFGEGEVTLSELVAGQGLATIRGLAYRKPDGTVVVNKPRELIADLDSLPFPAYYLYDAKRYYSPRVTAKKSPVAAIETSRGCPYSCVFCSKHIFQKKIRFKSPARVVDEMEVLLNLGYREIHIWDDCFSASLDHAKAVCDEIIKRKLKFSWNIYNGIRVDRVDKELLMKLKESGCYRVSFGIESGDQAVLDKVKKGITLAQIKSAVALAKEVGMETLGFFVIGLPGDTIKSIEKTIAFAKELDIDLPKVSIATPLPGTEFFQEYHQHGWIKSYNWSDYVFHGEKRVVSHPNLSAQEIQHYYDLFYRQLYLRPKFIARRIWRGLKTGDLFFDIYYFFKIFLNFKW